MDKSENQGRENNDENLGERLLTIKEVANLIDETPNVIRNWLKDLKQYIPLQKNESGYNVFDHTAIDQLRLIQQLHRDRNYSIRQIEHYLSTGGEAYKPVSEKKYDEIIADELKELKEQIKSLQEHNLKQESFNKTLIEKLDNQNKYISEKLNKRDQELTRSIRELQETRQLAAAQEKPWWKKIFS